MLGEDVQLEPYEFEYEEIVKEMLKYGTFTVNLQRTYKASKGKWMFPLTVNVQINITKGMEQPKPEENPTKKEE